LGSFFSDAWNLFFISFWFDPKWLLPCLDPFFSLPFYSIEKNSSIFPPNIFLVLDRSSCLVQLFLNEFVCRFFALISSKKIFWATVYVTTIYPWWIAQDAIKSFLLFSFCNTRGHFYFLKVTCLKSSINSLIELWASVECKNRKILWFSINFLFCHVYCEIFSKKRKRGWFFPYESQIFSESKHTDL
jgi:hypothetical protein